MTSPRTRRGAITGRQQHEIAIRPEDWRMLGALAALHGGSRADALERVCDGYREHAVTLATTPPEKIDSDTSAEC